MKRFALVVTNDPTLTRWEVHISICLAIRKLIAHGAFAQYLSADSAEDLCQREKDSFPEIRSDSCKIMSCCRT